VKLNNVRLKAKSSQTFTLYPLGDVHLGSANCDKQLFWDTIAEIRKNPDARWLGMGDMCEWITPKDKRWDAGGIDEMIVNLASIDRIGDVYVEKIADMLKPIMDKCWGMGDGNHEKKFAAEHGTNLTQRILQQSGAPGALYLGWEALTRVAIAVGNCHTSVRIMTAHGWQGGRMDGAKVNQMEKLLGWIDADIYLHGHSHSKFIVPVARLRVNNSCTKIIDDNAFVAHTGSFLRTYQQNATGYGEQAGYPPTSLGVPRFLLTPRITHSSVEVEIKGVL
jgi:hypothetical protein